MQRFEDEHDAHAFAEIGGQALFVTGWTWRPDKSRPQGHRRTDTAGQLFDMNPDRLAETARVLNGGSGELSVMEWRPGWGIFYVPIGGAAMGCALRRCHTRILRKTLSTPRLVRKTIKGV